MVYRVLIEVQADVVAGGVPPSRKALARGDTCFSTWVTNCASVMEMGGIFGSTPSDTMWIVDEPADLGAVDFSSSGIPSR